MSSPLKNRPETILGVTPNDVKILLLGLLSIEDNPKVNYTKMAQMGGYTVGSAGVLYRKSLKKLQEGISSFTAGDGTSTTPTEGTPVKKTPTKRKTTTPSKDNSTAADFGDVPDSPTDTADAAIGAVDGAAQPDTESPTKKRRSYNKKGIAVKIDKKAKALKQVQAEEDDDESACPPTPTPKGRGRPRSKAAIKKEEELAAAIKDEEEASTIKDEDHLMDLDTLPGYDGGSELELSRNSSVEREIDNMVISPIANRTA